MKKYEKINIEIMYIETSEIMNDILNSSVEQENVDNDDYAVM